MSIKQKTVYSEKELQEHIKSHVPSFYTSARTSTVIPYEKLADIFQNEELTIVDLSHLPAKMELNSAGNVVIRGAVSWKDARQFLRPLGLNIMTSPTEELALVLAGVATSCTGERCFSFGNLRNQIQSLKYFNFDGEEIKLHSDRVLNEFAQYQKDFLIYQNFKNAPFPRLAFETDLMTGTEGQLGVISEVELKVIPDYNLQHIFMLLPKWEENLELHLKLSQKIQTFRRDVLLCEFVDANSFNYLAPENRPNQNQDVIFFEVKSEAFDAFYEQFLSHFNEESIFELTESKFHEIRASIPRAIFEENARQGVVKKGTDIQVTTEQFKDLMLLYRELTTHGIDYNLFGHFGDAHLHFNFMPTPDQVDLCQELLEKLYKQAAKMQASPFAEHGIGIIKQKFIKDFWTPNQPKAFRQLKQLHDPYQQFFPQGFMRIQ